MLQISTTELYQKSPETKDKAQTILGTEISSIRVFI